VQCVFVTSVAWKYYIERVGRRSRQYNVIQLTNKVSSRPGRLNETRGGGDLSIFQYNIIVSGPPPAPLITTMLYRHHPRICSAITFVDPWPTGVYFLFIHSSPPPLVSDYGGTIRHSAHSREAKSTHCLDLVLILLYHINYILYYIVVLKFRTS